MSHSLTELPSGHGATEGQNIIFMAYITDQQGKGKVCKTYAPLIASTETKEINSVSHSLPRKGSSKKEI